MKETEAVLLDLASIKISGGVYLVPAVNSTAVLYTLLLTVKSRYKGP